MNSFATFISTVTEPMALILVIGLVGGWQAGLRGYLYMWYVLYLMGFSLVIWVARLRFIHTMHTNWDVSNRPKRVRLLLLLLGFSVFIALSLFVFQTPALTRFVFGLFLWFFGFFLITLKTKISGHMAVATLTVGWFWPMVFALPLIGWSRVVLKRHTVREVIGGFLYSLLWLSLGSHFLMR